MYDTSRSRRTVAHNCHGKSNLAGQEFLVSAVVDVQYNIDRDQKKPVSTIFIRNLEIKSPTVFCLAEVSDCSALIEVLLLFTEGHRCGYTTFPSL